MEITFEHDVVKLVLIRFISSTEYVRMPVLPRTE